MTKILALALALSVSVPAAAAGASYSATFTETRTLPGVQEPLVLHGTVTFTPGRRLDWTITRPYHYRLVVHDGRIEEHLPDGSEQTRPLGQTPWAAALFNLFSALFAGDTGALARYFKVTPGAHGFTLVPRSEMLAHSVKRIAVVGKPFPRTVTIDAADGARTRLAFRHHSPLPSAPTAASAGGG